MFDRNDGIFVRIFKVLGISYVIISWCVAGYLDFKESGIFLERRLTGVPKPPFINQLIKGLSGHTRFIKQLKNHSKAHLLRNPILPVMSISMIKIFTRCVFLP
jgi:hypothetical protein